jgi:hypothetical protein
MIPFVLWGCSVWLGNIVATWHATTYYNGSLAYLHEDADVLLHGHNPYADSATLWAASLRWPTLLPTPLLRGIYADCPLCYPAPKALQTQMRQEVSQPQQRRGEFDPATAHNYPAGVIWMAVPLVWAGFNTIGWLNIAAILGIALLVLLRAPAPWRIPLVALILCQTIVFYTSFDALCLVFVLAAWHWLPQRWLSPALLGWACAIKQLAWFFIPFYLIEIAHREGVGAAARRGLWLGAAFLLPNLPFILADPAAWWHSQLVPMLDPMFPGGVGIVAPALGGVWPLWPTWIYASLEGLAFLALIVVQWQRRVLAADGLILALLPLFFAWRDFATYIALLPLLALWVAVGHWRETPAVPDAPLPEQSFILATDHAS